MEQVKQGDKQPTQDEFTKNRAASKQERHKVREEQLAQGDWHKRHVLVFEFPKYVAGHVT
jgi:hypothetical protein